MRSGQGLTRMFVLTPRLVLPDVASRHVRHHCGIVVMSLWCPRDCKRRRGTDRSAAGPLEPGPAPAARRGADHDDRRLGALGRPGLHGLRRHRLDAGLGRGAAGGVPAAGGHRAVRRGVRGPLVPGPHHGHRQPAPRHRRAAPAAGGRVRPGLDRVRRPGGELGRRGVRGHRGLGDAAAAGRGGRAAHRERPQRPGRPGRPAGGRLGRRRRRGGRRPGRRRPRRRCDVPAGGVPGAADPDLDQGGTGGGRGHPGVGPARDGRLGVARRSRAPSPGPAR